MENNPNSNPSSIRQEVIHNGSAKTAVLLIFLIAFAARLPGEPASQKPLPAAQNAMAATRPATYANAPSSAVSIKVTVNSVLLNVSVRDRYSNRSVTGLERADFEVYEDGVLQQLQQAQVIDSPYSLLLLMDVSGSTSSFTKLMRQAAIDFTREIGPNDRIAIAQFNTKPRLVQDFTSDLDAAARAISRLRSWGGTAFYDALMTSVDRYMNHAAGREAIVLFTDGVDNRLEGRPKEGSRTSYEELHNRLLESDTIVYTIFLNSKGKGAVPYGGDTTISYPRMPIPLPLPAPYPGVGKRPQEQPKLDDDSIYRTAREQLEAIADLTGGRMYAPMRVDELSTVYSQVADDLRVRYLLSYASSNTAQDDGWRSVHVEVQDHPEAVVHTRKGYTVTALSAR
jgi:Ca-activated chloride channel family protein